jgi:hypothetical protein
LLDPNAVASGDLTSSSNSGGSATVASLPNPKSLKPHSITGSMNYIPYFTDSSNDLGNSILYQKGSNIGIGTSTPNAKLSLSNNVMTAPFSTSYGQYQILLYDGGSPAGSYGLGIEPRNLDFASSGGVQVLPGRYEHAAYGNKWRR